MTEAVINQLSFPDEIDNDHPPSKKIKLSPDVDNQEYVPLPNSPLNSATNSTPDKVTESCENSVNNDEFDPVQELLEAGKKCQEEEKERQRISSSSKTKKDTNREEGSDVAAQSKETDVLSASDSDDESESDGEVSASTSSKKSESASGKRNGSKKSKKKNKKSSHMRRNIKDILTHDQLDDLTIAARKEEEERRQRMNLKLQQQQQQLRFLQQQQQQLLKEAEAFNESIPPLPGQDSLGYPYRPGGEDLLMKRLMRKKHITVSLDDSGIPIEKNKDSNDVDCIMLSSDDESEVPPSLNHKGYQPPSQLPYPPFNFSSSTTFPSHTGLESELRRRILDKKKHSSEVISLSSGDEDNVPDRSKNSMPVKDHRVFDGATSTIGKGVEVDLESDDDCVIITPDPEGEEEVDDKDECSQDLLNVPDHLGRVLVNVGHPEEDNDIFLPPQIAKIVKPHQIGGIRFLYDNVVESKDRYNKSTGFGCILAHAMGLGKTLQTVSFCDVLLRTAGKTVLIIVPINTIQNWLNEFNRYLPAKTENCNGNDASIKRKTTKTRSGRKCDQDAEGCKQLQQDNSKVEQENCQGSEDTLLSNSFDSAVMLSTDLTPHEETPEMQSEASRLSQSESAGVCSTASQDSSLSSEESDIQYRTFEVYLLNETVKSLQARERTITTWTNKGGVLLIGYEMYRMLALKKLKKSSRRAVTLDHEERAAEAESLNKIYECLVDPGPDCVICDEGHRIKNSGAGISQALKAIKTKRRVVLTGYPLQNNLMEYWCMVDFVRPNYLGTKAEFSNMFERPIQNGQCADSTYEDKRLMKYRSHVLHSLLEGFVQRRSHVVLKNALPQKEEWVFLVKLTPIQLKIYTEFIKYLTEDLESDNASANPIKAFAVCCKIWNHPDVLWNVVKKNLDLEMDMDIDEVNPVARPKSKPRKGTGRPRGRPPLNGISLGSQSFGIEQYDDGNPQCTQSVPSEKNQCSGISLEWAKPLFENYTPEIMENGVKFELLFMLIKETVEAGDKLLVFSQSLLTLDLIEVFLKRRLDWKKSYDYVRLDGSTAGLEREKLINEFNSSAVQKLFIISTRAGSLGINLVGANRVCIFDASWNPCHDSQAVCRVYRYGQTKPCHIYRFVADCTLEKRIYDRQVNKKGMADRIVDEMNPNTPFKSKDVSSFLVLQHDLLEKLPYIKCDINFEKFTDPVLLNVLQKMGDKMTQEPFEHESLLIDQKHQKLSKSEKRLALKNYEKEKKTVANAYATYSRPNYSQYYSAIGQSTMNSASGSYSSSHSGGIYKTQSSLSVSHYHSEANGRIGSNSYSSSIDQSSVDRFERHIIALKSRGISVFGVQLYQDTYLQDPSGVQNISLRAGEKVYLLVSQKGTYLRVQGKLLRVPFMGHDITQEKAESIVMSLLQPPAGGNSNNSSTYPSSTYPAEQKLPPSNMNMMFQKNPNHLQITNSRNNTGGDVVMGNAANIWNTPEGSTDSSSSYHLQQNLNSIIGEGSSSTRPTTTTFGMTSDSFSFSSKQSSTLNLGSTTHRNPLQQPDLQSLSRLETFCHRNAFPFSQSQVDTKKWQSSSPSTSRSEHCGSGGPASDLEVIKLHHSQSSNSSNSSNSRTNSPYSKLNLNNSNDGSGGGGGSSSGAWANAKDPSFYTDFTITPIGSTAKSSNSKSRSQHQQLTTDTIWDTNGSRSPFSNELPRQKQTLPISGSAFGDLYGQSSSGSSSLLGTFGLGSTRKFGDLQLTDEMARTLNPLRMGLDIPVNNGATATTTSTADTEGDNVSLRNLLKDNGKFRNILGGSNLDLFNRINFDQDSKSHF